MLHDILGHDHIHFCTMTPSIDWTLHQFANLLPNWTLLPILTLLPNIGGFHRTLQRVRLANRGRLSYSSGHLVLSHLGLAFVLMLIPFFPELVMSTDLLSFEHSSVLLFCFLANRNFPLMKFWYSEHILSWTAMLHTVTAYWISKKLFIMVISKDLIHSTFSLSIFQYIFCI